MARHHDLDRLALRAARLLSRRRFVKAGALVRRVLERDPEHDIAILLWTKLAVRLGEVESAEARIRQLPREPETHAHIAVVLARAHLDRGDIHRARAWFRRAEEHPDLATILLLEDSKPSELESRLGSAAAYA